MTAQIENLASSLLAFQSDVPKIERSRKIVVTTKTGGHYSFSYAPLETILHIAQPQLAKNGLSISQLLSSIDGRPALETLLLHTSGETLRAVFPLPIGGHESPQEIGSLISYMRRYALISILGLATEEDDDANSASGNQIEPAKAEPTREQGRKELTGPHKKVWASFKAAETKSLISRQDFDTHMTELGIKGLTALSDEDALAFARWIDDLTVPF